MPNGISPSPTSHLPTGGWTTKSLRAPDERVVRREVLVDLFGLLEDGVDLHLEAEQDHRPALLDVVRLVEDELVRRTDVPEPHDPADRGEEQRSSHPSVSRLPSRRGAAAITEVVLRFPEQA